MSFPTERVITHHYNMDFTNHHVFYFNDKLHTHLVSLKPTASTSTLLLQGENVPFELELIGNFTNQYPCIDFNG